MNQRKRKTKEPCLGCGMHLSLCFCTEIFKIRLKTKICLLIHHRELRRTSNTGQLALRCLENAEMRVRGQSKEVPVSLEDLLSPEVRTLLFYPSDDAVELAPEFLAGDSRPIQLLVPDGNWRQASKVNTRHPELQGVPRVKFSEPNKDQYWMRLEHKPEGMSTLQAIAKALGIIEGPAAEKHVMDVYNLKLTRTRMARGQLSRELQD